VNVVLDVKITESDIKHLTMAQAKKPTRTVKEGERHKDLKFRDAVVAQVRCLCQPLFKYLRRAWFTVQTVLW
jgi:hypothetical protein